MSDFSSSRRHIGPWPIKRSQSVPDTPNSLFTPENSPPSLARFLANAEEESNRSRYLPPDSPRSIALHEKWSHYSMSQPAADVENAGRSKKGSRSKSCGTLNLATLMIRALWFLSLLVLASGPAFLVYFIQMHDLVEMTFPQELQSRVTLYVLIYLWATSIGTMIFYAFLYANDVRKNRRRQLKVVVLSLPILFAIGAILAILWVGTLSSLGFMDEEGG